ncbi:MAG: DUF177 domain-containing protein [Dysgonamonadaceae bacterium]|nr:DUF177 domain-containing protein [Dysgonamonadaceae bacterium]
MGKFDLYKVDLKGMQQDVQKSEYLLDNAFFTAIGGEDVQKGKVNVVLTITKTGNVFHFTFQLNGVVVIPCDRCLDDMDYPIETTARLFVKFGKDYAEESDEVVVVPESEGIINIAWFLYEFVALAISVKHVHAPGKCNKQMSSKLKKHTAKLAGEDAFDEETDDTIAIDDDETEETEVPVDSRWDALKELKESN